LRGRRFIIADREFLSESDERVSPDGAPADRASLTAEYLRRRYLVDGLTATQISVETGWSSQYVRDRLRDHKIPLRPRGLGKPRLSRDQLQGWVDAGLTVREIAERADYSTSGVHKLLQQFQIAVPERVRPPLAEQRLLDELATKYKQGRSLEALGVEYGHTADWVRARLSQAGVTVRPAGNRRRITTNQVRAGLDEGLRTSQIAQRLGCSDWAVLQVMREQGWSAPPPRPRGPSRKLPPVPDEDVLRDLYVEQQLTVAQIAATVGISTTRITQALQRYGIHRRKPGWTDGVPPAPVTVEQLHRLYEQDQRSIAETAAALHTTDTRVRVALARHRMTVRPERRPPPPLDMDEQQLTELYVHQRLDDEQIGQLADVPAWRVRQRIRQLGVRRPPVAPPRPPRPTAPPADELRHLYIEQGRTLAQIGRVFHTSAPVVRDWLEQVGIAVKPRTTRATRARLDARQVRELYEQRQWSSTEIAAHLDTTPALVLRTLHENDVPVRRGPSRRPPDPDAARLTALYADLEVQALLRAHGIPRRTIVGGIAERFPQPVPLTKGFLAAAYADIGLSATHIEQLTGQSTERVLAELRAHDIPVRSKTSFSPWFLRQRTQ
jgi:transposase